MTPGMIRTQLARLPDGTTFFCIARTVAKPSGGFRDPQTMLSIGLGCDAAHARDIVYADGVDTTHRDHVSEIGPGCRICDRTDCRQRAFPPLHHRLMVDEKVKSFVPYTFALSEEDDGATATATE